MEKVYSKLFGRIGNDMFRIACGLTLAKQRNAEYIGVIVNDKDYRKYIVQSELNYYLDKIKIIKEEDLNLNDVNFYSTKDWRDYVYIEIPNFHNIYMDCYFQCEKYFDKQLVLDFFDMPEHVKKNLYDKYGYLINKNVVSISVRRGDYVDMPNLFVPGNVEFINKAMKMFPEGQKYLVSSDDIEWCKNNIKGDNIYYVDKDKNILEDLFICTLCKGNIISNSTFSWWGAYLNKNENRKVIVQSPWFGRDNDIWLRGSKNIVPDDWIKIEQR